jgi:hypothetical protein
LRRAARNPNLASMVRWLILPVVAVLAACAPEFEADPVPRQAGVQRAVERAPLPRSDIEGPREITEDAAQLTPTFIAPRVPGRGLAEAGRQPDAVSGRLFPPAPGARLSVPMSW